MRIYMRYWWPGEHKITHILHVWSHPHVHLYTRERSKLRLMSLLCHLKMSHHCDITASHKSQRDRPDTTESWATLQDKKKGLVSVKKYLKLTTTIIIVPNCVFLLKRHVLKIEMRLIFAPFLKLKYDVNIFALSVCTIFQDIDDLLTWRRGQGEYL